MSRLLKSGIRNPRGHSMVKASCAAEFMNKRAGRRLPKPGVASPEDTVHVLEFSPAKNSLADQCKLSDTTNIRKRHLNMPVNGRDSRLLCLLGPRTTVSVSSEGR